MTDAGNGPGYAPLDQYGVIGDLHTAALVGTSGSIDWLCLPRFDSPSVFAALLDSRRGGRFRISAASPGLRRRQLYVPDTNVLITRFQAPDGVGEIHDCMPIVVDRRGATAEIHRLVRLVRAVRGTVAFDLECRPAFDYARADHTAQAVEDGVLFTSLGADATCIALLGSQPLQLDDGTARAHFVLEEHQWAVFELRYVKQDEPDLRLGAPEAASALIEETIEYWQQWLRGSTYRGRWREVVHRSALTLKLLTYGPTGAVVAAPTMGLPEEIGGERNWDYRYTWLRDAAFTQFALMRIGFLDEAGRFMDWLAARLGEAGETGTLQVLYGIDGRHNLAETVLPHLDGYMRSRPVRLGNDAQSQLQLDIYGEVLDAVFLYDKYGSPISWDLWQQLVRLLDRLGQLWQQPDESIWEVRGGRQHFVYSKLMCWVAFDRALRIAANRGFPAPRDAWLKARSAIYEQLMEHGYNREKQCFVQRYDGEFLDAANLMMPTVKFVSPTDPRMLSTIAQTRRALVSDSLVYRYAPAHAAVDGLMGREGTFSMCTFWLVEALARTGELREARLIFEKMLTYANPVGLYSEEISPSGELLGNYPQAFTHLGLISAAFNLDRFLDRASRAQPAVRDPSAFRS